MPSLLLSYTDLVETRCIEKDHRRLNYNYYASSVVIIAKLPRVYHHHHHAVPRMYLAAYHLISVGGKVVSTSVCVREGIICVGIGTLSTLVRLLSGLQNYNHSSGLQPPSQA